MIVTFNIFEASLASTMGRASSFDYDSKLPTIFYISKYDKRIKVSWNHNERHNMIERMERNHKADSVSDYLQLIQKAFAEVIPEIDKKGERYCIHLTDRDLYILFDVFKDADLWNIYTKPSIRIVTLLTHEPDYCYIIFEVDDSFYLI